MSRLFGPDRSAGAAGAAVPLGFTFDVDGLLADVALIEQSEWIEHFNQDLYSGDWSGLPLRGPADAIHPIQALSPVPGTTQWANQPILDQCPAIKAVMDSLHCPLLSVRLLRLGPGAVINEHFDVGLGIDHDELRVHVPIKTNPHIDFRAGGDRVVMEAGTLWYLDAEAPHSVANNGNTDRIHLVIDCQVNDWMRDLVLGAAVAK